MPTCGPGEPDGYMLDWGSVICFFHEQNRLNGDLTELKDVFAGVVTDRTRTLLFSRHHARTEEKTSRGDSALKMSPETIGNHGRKRD